MCYNYGAMGYGNQGFGCSCGCGYGTWALAMVMTGMDMDIVSHADIDDIWRMDSIEEKDN